MPRFDDGVVNSKLEKGDIILMGNHTQYGEILAENFLVEDITRANLQTLISASELVRGKCYRVTNAVGSTLSLIVQALTDSTITDIAYNTVNGDIYTYNITADTATQGIVSDVVDFDPQTAPSYLRGRVWYDSASETISYYDDISGTSTQIAQENHVRARNSTGSTILDGKVVYVNGATGQNPTIALARANAFNTSKVIGVVTHNIANNTIGKVTTFGIVNDIDTSAFNDGDRLYLSSSVAGELTATQPSAPNYAVFVGIVLNAHPTQGKILVHPSEEGIGFGTANQLLGMNAGATEQEYKTLSGTNNQVTVTHGVGGITLSLPQNIHTGATPTFAGLNIVGSAPSTFVNSNIRFKVAQSLTSINTHAFEDYSTITSPSPSGEGYCSFDALPIWTGSGNHSHLVGFQSRPSYQGSGNLVDYLYGFRSFPTHAGTGTVAKHVGVQIDDIAGVGPVTQSIGLNINNITRGSGSNIAIQTNGGSIRFQSLQNAGANPDNFVTINSLGYMGLRTPAQVLGDVGATSSSGVTIGNIPKLSATNTLANSLISESGANIIVNGGIFQNVPYFLGKLGTGSDFKFVLATDNYVTGGSISDVNLFTYGNNNFFISTNSTKRLSITGGGNATFSGQLLVSGAFSLGSGNAVTASVGTPSTHKVQIVINGTTYFLLASNV